MSSTNVTTTPSEVSASSMTSGTAQIASHATLEGPISVWNVDNVSRTEAVSQQPPPRALDRGTLDSVLLRDHPIGSFVASGADIMNGNLLGAFDPYSKLMNVPLVANALKPYAYFRGSLRVRAVCTPPGSCIGALSFSAICEGGLDYTPSATISTNCVDDLAVDNLFTSVNDTYRMINFEQASTVEIVLPFVYHQLYAPTANLTNLWMWRLQLQTWVPIQSTISTTAAATILFFASFTEDLELGVAQYQMKKSGHKVFDDTVDKYRGKANQKIMDLTGGHKVSDLASKVSSVAATAAGMIPMIAPFAAPIAAGAATVASIASYFGFTRESTFQQPELITNRLFSSLALVDGVDTGEKIVMLSGSALSIDPAISGGEHLDPMSFEAIRQRWGVVGYFNITTGTAAGAVLYNLPVTPYYAGVTLGSVFLSPGGYYGLPAGGWRGGMEYLIYIPSSPNMRGMLQLCYNPGVRAVAPPFVIGNPTGQVQTLSMDLSGTQQMLVSVPYSSPEPFKDSAVMCDGKYSNRVIQNCNGSIDFYLSAPWVAPRAGTVSTNVFILARPSADMKFTPPRVSITGVGGGLQTITYQSAPIDETVEVVEDNLLNLPLGEDDFNLAQSCVTEEMPSARALCQKFSWVFASTDLGKVNVFNQFPNPAMLSGGKAWMRSSNTVVGGYWNWTMHYALLFTGISGSSRLKIVARSQSSTTSSVVYSAFRSGLSPIDYTTLISEGAQGFHLGEQVFGVERALEFAFPYVSNRLYLNPRRNVQGNVNPGNFPIEPAYSSNWIAAGVSNDVTTCGMPAKVYFAAGDDFSVNRFRRVPRMIGAQLVPST